MKISDENKKRIIERLKENAIIKKYGIYSKAYDLLSEDHRGLDYWKNQYRSDKDGVDESYLRENDGQYVDMLGELEEMEQAEAKIDACLTVIEDSWQFEKILLELENFITAYDLWEDPEFADIIGILKIERNAEQEKEELVNDKEIERMMEEFDEYAESLLGKKCLENANLVDEWGDNYPGDGIVKKYVEQAVELSKRGIDTIEPLKILEQAMRRIESVDKTMEARGVQERGLQDKGGLDINND